MAPLWNFTQLVPEKRQRELLSVTSFDEIIRRFATGTVIFARADLRTKQPYYYRALFRIRLREADFDAFFNSPVGYRAQYCVEVEHGKYCNRQLIDALMPMCLNFAIGQNLNNFSYEMIIASLKGTNAKVWIDEDKIKQVEEIHIAYPPWMAKYKARNLGTLSDQAARTLARLGVSAPIGTFIEVKGGWIKPEGEEWLDPDKANRDQEIRTYGWT